MNTTYPIEHGVLRQVVADIDRIASAGLAEDLYAELAHRLRGWPSRDLDTATPGQNILIHHLADLAHRLLRAPRDDCLIAATEHVIETRRDIVLATLSEFLGQTPTQGSDLTPDGPTAIQRAHQQAVARQSRDRSRSS